MPDKASRPQWYGVRCVFQSPTENGFAYEERVTLWRAADIDGAIALAEAEANRYAEAQKVDYTGLAQAYWLFVPPAHGKPVFSLARESDLDSDAYLDQFFDTGHEVQGR